MSVIVRFLCKCFKVCLSYYGERRSISLQNIEIQYNEYKHVLLNNYKQKMIQGWCCKNIWIDLDRILTCLQSMEKILTERQNILSGWIYESLKPVLHTHFVQLQQLANRTIESSENKNGDIE